MCGFWKLDDAEDDDDFVVTETDIAIAPITANIPKAIKNLFQVNLQLLPS